MNVLHDIRNAVAFNGQYAGIPQEKRIGMIADTRNVADTVSVSLSQEAASGILLGYFTPRQRYIVQLRNGLDGKDPYTLEQVRERKRQILSGVFLY